LHVVSFDNYDVDMSADIRCEKCSKRLARVVKTPDGAWVQVNIGHRGKGSIQFQDDKMIVASNGRTKWQQINEPTRVECCKVVRIVSPRRVLERAGLNPYDPASNPFTPIREQLERIVQERGPIRISFTDGVWAVADL